MLSPETWLAIGTVTFAAAVGEGSFRKVRSLRRQLADAQKNNETLISHVISALVGEWLFQARIDARNFVDSIRETDGTRRLWGCHTTGCDGFADGMTHPGASKGGYLHCKGCDPESYADGEPGKWKDVPRLAGLCESMFTILNHPCPELPAWENRKAYLLKELPPAIDATRAGETG